jgi:hypothetical protein
MSSSSELPENMAPSSKTTGIICTILGGMLSLWVIARLSSAVGWQQTWAPPFAPYEWGTLVGAVAAAGLLIVGLLQWSRSVTEEGNHGEQATARE